MHPTLGSLRREILLPYQRTPTFSHSLFTCLFSSPLHPMRLSSSGDTPDPVRVTLFLETKNLLYSTRYCALRTSYRVYTELARKNYLFMYFYFVHTVYYTNGFSLNRIVIYLYTRHKTRKYCATSQNILKNQSKRVYIYLNTNIETLQGCTIQVTVSILQIAITLFIKNLIS